MRSSRRLLMMAWLAAMGAACEAEDVQLPAPSMEVGADAGGSMGQPMDRKAECDGALDGTPCGEGGLMHCVFGACVSSVCGDGVVVAGESCDDGNQLEGDGCPADCGAAACRDGKLDVGEECDDGNRENDDACGNLCTSNICGNGRKDALEECDDGNQDDQDGCANACTLNACGNNRTDPGEECDGDRKEGLSCKADCSAYENDTCTPCMVEHCTNYLGEMDLYTPCHVATDGIIENPMKGFVERCRAADACILANKGVCWDPTFAMIYCACGAGNPTDTCQRDGLKGPCADSLVAAAGCETEPDPTNCYLNNAQELTRPSGIAWYLEGCRREYCQTECAY